MNAITQPTPVAGTDSPAALLPEPKSTKELCARIASMNDTTVDPDDPVLMVYTIHTAALEDHAAMLLVGLAMISGAGPVAMMVWAVGSVLAWGWAWRLARNDHHYDRLLFFAPRFWKLSRRPTRTLIAGRFRS